MTRLAALATVATILTLVGARNAAAGDGACCFADGSCVVTSAFGCEKAGGLYMGDGVSCSPDLCVGACCLGGGKCLETSLLDCFELEGAFLGPGVPCDEFTCFGSGACCLSDGSCADVSGDVCVFELGGVFLGAGTFCASGDCDGACCFPDGSCEPLDGGTCDELGGEFAGHAVTCENTFCPPPTGACCLQEGTCVIVSEDACASVGGSYQGDLTSCNTAECPFPEGACCLPDGSCFDGTEDACLGEGGDYQGDFEPCEVVSCLQPEGACCFSDGACEDLDEPSCVELGGTFAGSETDCRTSDCPQPGEINFEAVVEFITAGVPRRKATGNLGGSFRDDVAIVLPGDDPSMPGSVQVFVNLGGASSGGWPGLEERTPIPVGREPSDVAVGLFNDDAFADMAVTNEADGTLSIFFNDGTGQGTFLPPMVMTVGNRPTSVTAAPFDTQPGVDLVVALGGENRIILLSNDGRGYYMETASGRTGQDPGTVEPEDVDNDKDFDVIAANKGDGTVTITRIEGDGFAGSETIPVGPDPNDVATGDVDGNGFNDVLTADAGTGVGPGGGTLSLILNFGGTFIPAIQVPVGAAPRSLDLADLDGDGDLDLAVSAGANGSGENVQVLVNDSTSDGGNPFGAPMSFGIGGSSVEVTLLRLDDDSRHDVLSINLDTGPTGGSVSALINATLAAVIDCNGNGEPDDCDIALGVSEDCDGNGIPDECDTAIRIDPAETLPEDICALADPICPGIVYDGDTTGATSDGDIFCGVDIGVFDVWYAYTAAWDGQAFVTTFGPGLDPVLTIYDGCPNLGGRPIVCNDLNPNGVVFEVARGATYYVRVAGGDFDTGPFTLSLVGPDCVLNLADFDADGIPDVCQCPYDVNGDGIVDDFDVILALAALGAPCKGCPADVDGSGAVTASDVQLILINRGPCPEPPDPPGVPAAGCP